jgi:hypothetical protein
MSPQPLGARHRTSCTVPVTRPFLKALPDSSTFTCRVQTTLSALSYASGSFPSRIPPPLLPGMIWSRWLPPMLTQQGVGDALARIVIREGLIDRAVVNQWRSPRPIAKKSVSAPLACPGSEPFLLNLAVAAPTITLGVGSCARKTRIQLVLPFAILEQLDQGDSYSSRLP